MGGRLKDAGGSGAHQAAMKLVPDARTRPWWLSPSAPAGSTRGLALFEATPGAMMFING